MEANSRGRLRFINTMEGMRGIVRSSQSVLASNYDEMSGSSA
jgi:hypothetical protein